jgi:hypothetical protein
MKWLILMLILTGCASARPWTAQEKIMLSISCLAVVADMTTTINRMHDGGYETNPTMGKHPSDGTVISVMALTQVVTIIVAHYWGPWRSMVLGIKTGINAGFAFHNVRTD